MKVGIICAGDEELAPFLPLIENCKITEKSMLKFHEGKINDVEVVALYSGVCKVNAAIATQILIDTFSVNIIINSGTAGGMDPHLEIFDTVISTEVEYHDVAPEILTEFHPWLEKSSFVADKELLNLSKNSITKLNLPYKIYFGKMVTGESFITDEGRQEINEKFRPLTVDMESASVAHVCYVNKIPFISIRTITDTPKHRGIEYFETNCKNASEISKNITIALLSELYHK
jgi:adenosylhomocysteine nucleosidase